VKDPTYLSIRKTLAEYLSVQPAQVRPDQRLDREWGLDRTELSGLALRLEEVEDIEIRSEDLDAVQTVGQLVALVRSIRRREELAEEVTRVRPHRSLRTAAVRPMGELGESRRLKVQGGGSR